MTNQRICWPFSVPPLGSGLRADFPFVFKQWADQVDLHCRHQHHDDEINHWPKVHPVKVTLLEVSVPSLEGPQHRLDLHAFTQPALHVTDGVLKEMRRTRQDERICGQNFTLPSWLMTYTHKLTEHRDQSESYMSFRQYCVWKQSWPTRWVPSSIRKQLPAHLEYTLPVFQTRSMWLLTQVMAVSVKEGGSVHCGGRAE